MLSDAQTARLTAIEQAVWERYSYISSWCYRSLMEYQATERQKTYPEVFLQKAMLVDSKRYLGSYAQYLFIVGGPAHGDYSE